MRTLCLVTFGFLVGLVVFNYDLKLQTKALEDQAAKIAGEIQDQSDFVALMRAEVSHLSRPGRIDTMARSILKFEPVSPAQTLPLSAVMPTSGQTWRPEIAQTQSPSRTDGIAALIDRATAPASASQSR